MKLEVERINKLDRLAKPGATRDLMLAAAIIPEVADIYVGYIDHWRRRDPGKPVTITFNTPGGSAIDGFMLYEAIQRLRATGSHVTTKGTGEVASMGAVLMQSGDHRVMDPSCLMMVHKVSGHLKGTAEQMDDQRVALDLLQQQALDVLAARSTLSRDEIESKWSRKDWFLSAQQALDAGFIDEVEYSSPFRGRLT